LNLNTLKIYAFSILHQDVPSPPLYAACKALLIMDEKLEIDQTFF